MASVQAGQFTALKWCMMDGHLATHTRHVWT